MKIVKIVLFSFVLAVIAFFIYRLVGNSQETLSPLPEEGIKVIQISPTG